MPCCRTLFEREGWRSRPPPTVFLIGDRGGTIRGETVPQCSHEHTDDRLGCRPMDSLPYRLKSFQERSRRGEPVRTASGVSNGALGCPLLVRHPLHTSGVRSLLLFVPCGVEHGDDLLIGSGEVVQSLHPGVQEALIRSAADWQRDAQSLANGEPVSPSALPRMNPRTPDRGPGHGCRERLRLLLSTLFGSARERLQAADKRYGGLLLGSGTAMARDRIEGTQQPT